MLKNDYCGALRPADDGREAVLAGWVHRRRDHGGLIFIDLRDSTGLVQVVLSPQEAPEAHAAAEDVRNEYVVSVRGTVRLRRPGTENDALPTGGIEVHASAVEVLNAAKTPPFYINEEQEVDELLRLKFRYLDLRRPVMLERLVLRHRAIRFIREFLNERGFIEVETPVLIKATPEGARDYLVPSRLHPGEFYALPQSPQQLKQLLMVAGVERYYQIARCFRDEDQRADRQPEFTQLDLEMSFVEQEDILTLMEALFAGLVADAGRGFRVPSPFPRLTYAEALERYGSDKPDLRFGMELHDLSGLVSDSEFAVFRSAIEAGGRVRAFAAPGAGSMPRRQLDELTEVAKQAGAKGLVWVTIGGEGALDGLTADDVRSPAARFLPPELVRAMAARVGGGRGDLLLIVADEDARANQVLDVLRREMARRLDLADPTTLHFAIVTDFPMFEWDAAGARWDALHHPFTAPNPEDLHLLATDPGSARALAYDIVCNGWELGSGSIRIHERELQERVFALLGLDEATVQERFGHLLQAFEYGAPPHGGFAPGIDRTVALLAGVPNIREVIAFPKTQSAQDPMLGAPSPVANEQLADLHVRIVPPAP